jgi:acyl-CoA synthetase (AMP-forming)/AMP-acid ligase II
MSALMQKTGAGFDGVIDAMFERFAELGERPALFWRGQTFSYAELLELIRRCENELEVTKVPTGEVVALYGEFTPRSCALFFALMRRSNIIVPLTSAVRQEADELKAIAGVQWTIDVDANNWEVTADGWIQNDLIFRFRSTGRAGLVVFTSGSAGRPKGILHDCGKVLAKFLPKRRGWRTLLFLMMDHFGGFNTFISALAYGGTAVCLEERSPEAVCRVVEQAKVDLLPTTPTFLRLLLLSGAAERHDLSSVQLITYGAEPMPQATLDRVRAAFPKTKFKQTYGLSELGVLRSASPEDSSTWLRVGGSGFETRIVDGVLWIRSQSSMVGYLNAPNPFDHEGWMNTGDRVEEQGGLIRFLGRETEVINVGGQKVFPSEVENVLLAADNVRDATVFGQAHSVLGQAPCARVVLEEFEPVEALSARLRQHCLSRLAKFKIPMRFTIENSAPMNKRLKKNRDEI